VTRRYVALSVGVAVLIGAQQTFTNFASQ